MKRIKLEIAYDGTNYHGWQIQPNAVTVEGKINTVLSELCKEEIAVIGASRTDAGVHAYGNVAVFDTNSPIPPEKFAYALNAHLPWDIRVQSSKEVASDFHPRHCDSKKTYEYHILNRKIAIPSKRLYSYHFHWDLDIEAMQKGAEYLRGFAPETIVTAILFSMVGFFNGNEKTVWVMIQGLIQTLLVRLPLAYIMSIQPHASLTKIGLAAPVATCFGIVLNVIFYIVFVRKNTCRIKKK